MRNTKIHVFAKTGGRCSVCGTYDRVNVGYFFPTWVSLVDKDIRNMIPICSSCKVRRGVELFELKDMNFLPLSERNELMKFYKSNRNYLRKCILSYGMSRTNNLLNLDYSKLVLKSYDFYIENNEVK